MVDKNNGKKLVNTSRDVTITIPSTDVIINMEGDPKQLFEKILSALPAPEITVPQAKIDERVNKNLNILKSEGIDTAEKIQEFINNTHCHDINTIILKTIAKQLPNGAVNFTAMHDTKLWGKFTENLTGDQLGWYLGTIIGAGDLMTNIVVSGVTDGIFYHRADVACLEKLVNANYVKKASAFSIFKIITESTLANLGKNLTRIPIAAVVGGIDKNSEGLVNTNNVPVINRVTGKAVIGAGVAGIVDNAVDSFLPVVTQTLLEYWKDKQLAPVYAASLLLREDLKSVIDRTKASWGTAIKNGFKKSFQGIIKNGVQQLSIKQNLLPNLISIACIGGFVVNVVNTNSAIKNDSRDEYIKANPDSAFANNGTLIEGLVPLTGWIYSRTNSMIMSAKLTLVVNTLYAAVDSYAKPLLSEVLTNLWNKMPFGGGRTPSQDEENHPDTVQPSTSTGGPTGSTGRPPSRSSTRSNQSQNMASTRIFSIQETGNTKKGKYASDKKTNASSSTPTSESGSAKGIELTTRKTSPFSAEPILANNNMRLKRPSSSSSNDSFVKGTPSTKTNTIK